MDPPVLVQRVLSDTCRHELGSKSEANGSKRRVLRRPRSHGRDPLSSTPLTGVTGWWFGAVGPGLLRAEVTSTQASKRCSLTCGGRPHLRLEPHFATDAGHVDRRSRISRADQYSVAWLREESCPLLLPAPPGRTGGLRTLVTSNLCGKAQAANFGGVRHL